MKKIIIFGAGSGGKEVLNIVIKDINKLRGNEQFEVLGFVDKKLEQYGEDFDNSQFKICDLPLINISSITSDSHIFGVCDVMRPKIKKEIVDEEIIGNDIQLATLVHPNTFVSSSANIGRGSVVNPFSSISYDVSVGKCAKLNFGSHIGHNTVVGDFTFVGPSATIAGNCTIGDLCIIGAGATIIDGIKVPNNTIIGAGSVVTQNIEKSGTYIGNPVRKII